MSQRPNTSSRKPPLIPEPQPHERDTALHRIVRGSPRRRERLLWAVALILFIALGFVGTVLILQPQLIGLEATGNLTQTAGAFQATGAVLGNTAVAVQNIDSANAQTASALDGRVATLDSRETQSAEDIRATTTSIAVANARQATSIALDFRSTQIAFEQEATQVELNYRGTQAALNRDATAIALGFVTQGASAPLDPSQTPIPTVDNAPFFEDGFIEGVNSSLWRLGDVNDWGLNEQGQLVARRDGAWLVTQIADLTEYTFRVDLVPLAGIAADYYLLLNDPLQGGTYTLRLSYDGARLTNAGLYTFNGMALIEDLLTSADLSAVQAVQLPGLPASAVLSVTVDLRGTALSASTNGQNILTLTFPAMIVPGSVGLQVPAETVITRVALDR